jgi:3-oxoacyl-[acyl-carrier-protein] synthase-3
MKSVYITALSAFLPNDPVPNEGIEDVLGKLEHQPARVKNFVLSNNGIKTRHYAIDPSTGRRTHTNAQLAAEAVRRLLASVELPVSALQGLACGTSSPDQIIPSHANMVAGELGMEPAEIVSTAGVCASGMTALKYGWMNVASGLADNFAASGSERASAFLDRASFGPMLEARDEAALQAAPTVSFEKEFLRWMLSDGAGAVLLEPALRADRLNLRIDLLDVRSWAGQLPVCMYTGMNKQPDGSFAYWADEPERAALVEKGYLLLQQDARVLERHMVDVAARALEHLTEIRGLDPGTVDWFLPHLSSMYFKGRLMERMLRDGVKIPEEKWFTNLADKGNTGAASIYIMLDELYRSGRLSKGQRILCAVPESARFTMAGMLLTVC